MFQSIKFNLWLESRQFRRLIPQEVLDFLPILKQKAQELSVEPPPFTLFAKIPDPFFPGEVEIAFLSSKEWQRLGLRGVGVASSKPTNNTRICYYLVPMSDFSTLYHELVHIFDPKFAKGLSKTKLTKLGTQDNTTPHEIDAHLGGYLQEMREKLISATEQDKQELKNWLRNPNKEADPWTLPKLINGINIHIFTKDPKIWRKFVSSVWNLVYQT